MDDNPRTIEKPTQIKLFDLREVGYPEKGGQLKIDLADENDERELDMPLSIKSGSIFICYARMNPIVAITHVLE